MIGRLPKSLNINGIDYEIRSDYRDCLIILQAFSDPDITSQSKYIIMMDILYKDMPPEEVQEEACIKAIEFLDGGKIIETDKPNTAPTPKLYDWEQDEQIIFSAINKVAGKEIRSLDYMHWWSFLGLFNEIGEGVFSSIVSIRRKKALHKKLEKYEKEYYKNNKDIIDLKVKLSEEEKEKIEAERLALDELLFGKEVKDG